MAAIKQIPIWTILFRLQGMAPIQLLARIGWFAIRGHRFGARGDSSVSRGMAQTTARRFPAASTSRRWMEMGAKVVLRASASAEPRILYDAAYPLVL